MAARKTKKKTAAAPAVSSSSSEFRVLRAFHHLAAEEGTFGFSRYYWSEGAGHRQSILANLRKKRRPVSGNGEEDTAARVEVLLPSDAPEEYTDMEFLVRRYEEKLPLAEASAYAQVTLKFPDVFNSHHSYEMARAWTRSFYVDDKRVPVILILHNPFIAGSDSHVHTHALVLLTRLGRFSWGKRMPELATDEGQQAALMSWRTFKEEWRGP